MFGATCKISFVETEEVKWKQKKRFPKFNANITISSDASVEQGYPYLNLSHEKYVYKYKSE